MKKINFLAIVDFLKPWIYYLALLAIPLGMSIWLPIYSPFVVMKTAWLHILGALFLIFSLLSIWLNRNYSWFLFDKKYWLIILPWFIFLIFLLFANIFSFNQTQSFFGSYDRQLGFLFYVAIAVWFSLIVYHFSSGRGDREIFWQKGVKRSVLLMVLVATLVAVYACLQFFGYDFTVWQEPQMLSRSISSLGQPNFLASFLLFGLSMSVYLFYISKSFLPRFFIIISGIIQLLALVFSGSRSAWISFLLTFFIISLISLWRRWRLKAVFFALVILAFLSLLLFSLAPTRALGLLSWQEGSLGLRTYFYRAAPLVIEERPWLGVGLENGGEAMVAQYQPDWGIFMKINAYTDKVHNSILDIIIQLGLIGFIFYVFLYLFIADQVVSLWRRRETRAFALAAAAALLAYSISLLFGLADLANVFYFWVIAGLVTAGNINYQKLEEKNSRFERCLKRLVNLFKIKIKTSGNYLLLIFLSFILFVFAVFQIYFGFKSVQADHYFLNLYKQSLNREYFTADLLYQYILEDVISPINLSYYQRSYAFLILGNLDSGMDFTSKRLMRGRAETLLSDLPSISYDDIYAQANLQCFLNEPVSAQVNFDYLQSLSPSRPAAFFAEGDCEKEEHPEKALKDYNRALSLLPSFDDARLQGEHKQYLNFYAYSIYKKIADLNYDNKNYEQALLDYRQAYSLYPADISLLKNIANTSFYLQDYQLSYQSLEHAYLRQPQSYWLLQLASLASTLKDDKRSFKYLEMNESLYGSLIDVSPDSLIFP